MMTDLTQSEIREFVSAAHGDLETVKARLAAEPRLLNARFDEWNESALEAAAHTGQRAIAEHLLAAGAPLTVCSAAMLGRTADVERFVNADPAQANARGAHGFPLMFHAALGGQTQMAEMLLAHGGGEGLAASLQGAVAGGRVAMAEWLLDHGADIHAPNWQDKTPLEVAEARADAAMAATLRARGALR